MGVVKLLIEERIRSSLVIRREPTIDARIMSQGLGFNRLYRASFFGSLQAYQTL
jgi:hypothetical protein